MPNVLWLIEMAKAVATRKAYSDGMTVTAYRVVEEKAEKNT